jgi:uncharacterized C2H2 Zn-finger protein
MSIKIKLKSNVNDRRCHICDHIFSRRDNMLRHIRDQHQQLNSQIPSQNDELKGIIISLKKQIEELKEKQTITNQKQETIFQYVEELKNKPNITNNVLQVVCVTHNDNYLDMLTQDLQDFDKALDYIKNCALSNINGDCQLIEKIYCDPSTDKPSFHYLDKSRTKIEYFNEKKELAIDKKEHFGRKLANNLQNSYLKGINYVINDNLDNRRCPNKFLEEYDIQTWNQHIYNLSDSQYQRKLINQLNVPNKT